MKIRFYHNWIYRLFSYFWTPIFEANPHRLRNMIAHAEDWLRRREKKSKPHLRRVK